MAFVRTKKIKGNKYYYLVESRRVGGAVVQRVLKYLGASPAFPVEKKKKQKRKKRVRHTRKSAHKLISSNQI